MTTFAENRTLARRDFLVLAAVAAGGALPRALRAGITQPVQTTFDWTRIAPNVHVAFGSGGNSLLVTRAGEALLVDTKVAAFGGVLRREASALGAAVRCVVNTHHHGDHIGGNDAFTNDVLTVAQTKAKDRVLRDVAASLARLKGAPVDAYATGLRRSGFDVRITPEGRADIEAFIRAIESAKPEQFAPTVTFDTERELRAAGYAIHVHHVTPGHTDNDVIVHIPELNVLHAGDLLFNQHHTFVDVSAGASTAGWDRCLAKALELCNASTVVVAGHGPTTDRAGLQRQRDYFNRLRDVVASAKREGKSRTDVVALKPAPFADLAWPGLLADTLGVLYDESSR